MSGVQRTPSIRITPALDDGASPSRRANPFAALSPDSDDHLDDGSTLSPDDIAAMSAPEAYCHGLRSALASPESRRRRRQLHVRFTLPKASRPRAKSLNVYARSPNSSQQRGGSKSKGRSPKGKNGGRRGKGGRNRGGRNRHSNNPNKPKPVIPVHGFTIQEPTFS